MPAVRVQHAIQWPSDGKPTAQQIVYVGVVLRVTGRLSITISRESGNDIFLWEKFRVLTGEVCRAMVSKYISRG